MKTYRVYHVDRPGDSVIVKHPNYMRMQIKSRAIEESDTFTWADYTSLRIKRIEGLP